MKTSCLLLELSGWTASPPDLTLSAFLDINDTSSISTDNKTLAEIATLAPFFTDFPLLNHVDAMLITAPIFSAPRNSDNTLPDSSIRSTWAICFPCWDVYSLAILGSINPIILLPDVQWE